jgi:hypothetical protein
LTPLVGPEPDVARFRNIDVRSYADGDEDWAEVRVAVKGAVHAAFSFLATVADRLQLNGEDLALALPYALEAHRGVFAARAGLTPEKEVGLYGELLLVDFLIKQIGAKDALDAWTGPLSEEHDFAFDHLHMEVKTTNSERRRHIIGSAQQLAPLPGIPLWLTSIQLTSSGGGSGLTLPGLIGEVSGRAGAFKPALDLRLRSSGWDDDESDLYPRAWALRGGPRGYLVHEGFPAITQERLRRVVPHVELVSDVSYRVDVTDMPASLPPSPLGGFYESSTRRIG